MRGALLAGAAGLAQAMPSFRERLPNAYGVECPGDHWEGCTSTGLCMGLGHTQCAGGGALGAFGVSFLQHGYEWTTAMCEDDADGDGHYELTVANYEIPAWRTIYADFIWDAPQEHMDRCAGENSCYLVGLEAIIDESRHVHHYILNGCKEPWAAAHDYSPGMAREVGFGVGCRWQFGGWAPGKNRSTSRRRRRRGT
ncbi:hypothetical protein JL722_7949 [Aureococcus anophagefferens]|nr:hypothetical protein JL722_7949 [Aureococcus anophagefferens]